MGKKLFIVMLVGLALPLNGELLIVKRDGGKIKPLTEKESIKYQEKINDVLMKYQWPMCLSSDLTPEEIAEYLESGKPCAEEQFVQKKLHEVVDPAEIDLQVMFVPTSIYELHVILREALRSVPYIAIDEAVILALQEPDSRQSKRLIREAIKDANAILFASKVGESDSSFINRKMTTYLFRIFPELQEQSDIASVSDIVRNNITTVLEELFKNAFTLLRLKAGTEIGAESIKHILNNVIKLEYLSRESNEALLFRGSSVVMDAANFKHSLQTLNLIGSTVRGKRSVLDVISGAQSEKYSISFGQSLFAGYLRDRAACSYDYLIKLNDKAHPFLGYGLSLSKKHLFIDGDNDLFYMTGLGTLAALVGKGVFFHPRTKVAVMGEEKPSSTNSFVSFYVHGLSFAPANFVDPNNVFLVQRNPAYQEELFSQCLIKRGYVLHRGSENDLTPTEKNAIKDVLNSQAFLAQEYKKIRILSRKALLRLLRAGTKSIPGVSKDELEHVLKDGPTDTEYARLQKGLLEIELEPVTKEILSLSTAEMLDQIKINRGLEIPLMSELLHWKTTLTLGRLNVKQIDQVIQSIEKGLNSSNKSVQNESMKVASLLITPTLIKDVGSEKLNYLIQLLISGLRSADEDIRSKSMSIVKELFQRGLIKGSDIQFLLDELDRVQGQEVNGSLEKLKNDLRSIMPAEKNINSVGNAKTGMLSSMRKSIVHKLASLEPHFLQEAKRKYLTSTYFKARQQKEIALMEQQRNKFESRNAQLVQHHSEFENYATPKIPKLVAPKHHELPIMQQMKTPEQIAMAARIATQKGLPRAARSVIR